MAVLNRVWRPDFQWTGLGASLIFVSSFLCEAAYSVMGKPIVAKASVMKMLALSLLAGTAVNLLIDGPQTLAAARMLPPGPGFCCWSWRSSAPRSATAYGSSSSGNAPSMWRP